MRGTPGYPSSVLILCLALAGCSGTSKSWSPFKTTPAVVPGVVSPAERLTTLKSLADDEPKITDTGRREQICHDLAEEIRKEDDPGIRGEIIHTLGVYGGPTAESILRVAVNDKDADVRIAACVAWSKHPGPEAIKVLGAVLSSDIDKDVRLAAARALAKCHDPAAIAALGPALEDADPAMQHRGVESLREATGKDLGSDVNRWREFVKSNSPGPAIGPGPSNGPALVDRPQRMF